MKPAGWFIPMAMIGLARQMGQKPHPFTSTDLFVWLPELGTSKVARLACIMLKQRGVLAQAPHAVPDGFRRPTNPQTWQLTESGLEICRATLQAATRKANAEQLVAHNRRQPKGHTLRYRLWSLLRIRTALTSEDAVSVLADAGEETRTLQSRISRQLRAWSVAYPDAVQLSAKRIGGHLRYVLVQDLGATPPTTNKAGGQA